MRNSTCETIRLGLDSPRPGVDVRVGSKGQPLKATCAALAATYYWALQRNATNGNSKMSADGYVVEAWHV